VKFTSNFWGSKSKPGGSIHSSVDLQVGPAKSPPVLLLLSSSHRRTAPSVHLSPPPPPPPPPAPDHHRYFPPRKNPSPSQIHGGLRRRHPPGRRGVGQRQRQRRGGVRRGRALLPLPRHPRGPAPHPRAGRGAGDVPERAGAGARALRAPPPRHGLLGADAAGPVGHREGVRG
jgi:hypothetical protein